MKYFTDLDINSWQGCSRQKGSWNFDYNTTGQQSQQWPIKLQIRTSDDPPKSGIFSRIKYNLSILDIVPKMCNYVSLTFLSHHPVYKCYVVTQKPQSYNDCSKNSGTLCSCQMLLYLQLNKETLQSLESTIKWLLYCSFTFQVSDATCQEGFHGTSKLRFQS